MPVNLVFAKNRAFGQTTRTVDTMDTMPRVTGSTDMAVGKFLSLKKLSWLDANGVSRTWESAERPAGFLAVMIIPRLLPSGRLALIKQFRPPAKRWVIEFPAGILEPGETPEAGAARELREETGYIAESFRVLPASFTSPGMSDEAVFVVHADIDENDPRNQAPRTDFDPSEMIHTLLVPPEELPDFHRRQSDEGTAFDCKLAAYIAGLGARSL